MGEMHYQTHNPDDVFCHVCVSAPKFKRMDQSRGYLAFTSNGIGRMPSSALKTMKHLQAIKKPWNW